MTEGIILALIGALFSAFIGGLVNKFVFTRKAILPIKFKSKKREYSFLKEIKHEYRLIFDPDNPKELAWASSNIDLTVYSKNLIRGKHKRLLNKEEAVDYKIVGEIREGQMILTETCEHDPTQFFTAIYPNISSTARIPGLVISSENPRFVSAFTLLSSEILPSSKLNKYLNKENFRQLIEIDKEVTKDPYFISIFNGGGL